MILQQSLVKVISHIILIGKIESQTDSQIILKDVCHIFFMQSSKQISINKIKGPVTIRGSCCVIEVDETDEIYAPYMQLITGLIPPTARDIENLKKKRNN